MRNTLGHQWLTRQSPVASPSSTAQQTIGPYATIWSARKRVLALDGGGTRGIVSIAFLERIETLLQQRSKKGDQLRLSDHFHLIGGTSTGAIIAAGLALGRSVADIKSLYLKLGPAVFRRRWHLPFIQARYGSAKLRELLEQEFGPIELDDGALKTLLAIVTKRVDTGSPWVVSNLPGQPYWEDAPNGRKGNRSIRLSSIVRASAAAPFFFGPERIPISADVTGTFVDGAVSPFNSPTIPLLMLTRAARYGLKWPLGPKQLSIVSIGTGRSRVPLVPSVWTPSAKLAVDGLKGMIEDTMAVSVMLMQWLGESEAPAWINRDLGTLDGDPLTGRPLFSFQRLDVRLEEEWLESYFGLDFEAREIIRLRRLDDPGSMLALYDLAREVARRTITLADD